MYETLIMLKPGQTFSGDEMENLVKSVCATGAARVSRRGSTIQVRLDSAHLNISYSDGPWVREEADELAANLGISAKGCQVRFEMAGENPDMALFNEYLLINERLDGTERFVIFDAFSGTLFGES